MLRIEAQYGGCLQHDVPMSEHTTLGIGGPSRTLARASSAEELMGLMRLATEGDVPFLVIGGGSNLLVADQGVDRLVLKNEDAGISVDGDLLRVRSGTVLQDLVDYTLAQGYSGMQRITGIPGTVGGAVYGNAGAYGQNISDFLVEVDCFDGRERHTLDKGACRFAYRHSIFKENRCAVLESRFRLDRADPALVTAESHGVLSQRLVKYPVGLKCPGSFFKNVLAATLPPETLALIPSERIMYGKIPAGYLLQEVGVRGLHRGGIQVSPTNANLFMNVGGGTAADLYSLATECAGRVRDRFHIHLQPEVQFINLPPLPI
ncbi:MAG: UDP-N-acetylmuramate dehydrogenase [Chloroflexota bacterium]